MKIGLGAAGGLLLSFLIGSGCAEAPFSVHARDNDLLTLRQALAQMHAPDKGPQNGSGHAMAYIFAGPEHRPERLQKGPKGPKGTPVAKKPEKAEAEAQNVEKTLYGYDLSTGKEAFAVPADVRSRFVVGRNVLVFREGTDTLSIRDPMTGQVRARVPLPRGQTLVGVAADDERIYYVTQGLRDGQRWSTVTALSPGGLSLWSVQAPGSVGAPAARGGLLALPYRYQDVVLLSGRTGAELSRIRERDEGIGFVRATREGLFYGVGDRGVALLNERSVKGQKGEIAYFSPNLGEKVRVFLHWDGYRPEQTEFSAFDRNRLLWSASTKDDRFSLKDDLFVVHSYRFFFAIEPGGDKDQDRAGWKVRWAYAQPRQNVMASDENDAVVVMVAQDGEIGALDLRTGAKVYTQKLQLLTGQQVLGATLDTAGFAPVADKAQAPEVLPVLHGIIFDKDSSFIAVKTFAVQALNSIHTKEATAELLRVATAEAMPAQVSRAAGEALVARRDRDVGTMLVKALSDRYDYLDDRQPRGVGILARAAAAMGEKEAIPALSSQLWDVSASPAVLKDVVSALVKLGSPDAVRPLREMVLLYRSDPAFASDAEPLRLAGEGLLKLGGETGRRTVYFVAEEPRTIAPVASYYRKILDETARKTSTKAKAAEESPEAAPQKR